MKERFSPRKREKQGTVFKWEGKEQEEKKIEKGRKVERQFTERERCWTGDKVEKIEYKEMGKVEQESSR